MKSKIVLLLAFLLMVPAAWTMPALPSMGQGSEHSHEKGSETSANCAHGTAKDHCYICTPALRDKTRLWCREHTRYEDRCFLCHPEIRDNERLYCKEHWLYEDECYICHPEITPPWQKGKDKKDDDGKQQEKHAARSDSAAREGGLFCNEHQVYESECGICHPGLLKSLKVGEGLKVRFTSTASGVKAGIRTGKPEQGMALPEASFLCRLTYNQSQFAKVTPLASGVVRKVLADFGDQVEAGAVLAELASPELADAKAAYLDALSELKLRETVYKREKGLYEKNVSSQQDYDEAEAGYAKAMTAAKTTRQKLKNYGLGDRTIDDIASKQLASSNYRVAAPYSGTIVDRMAVVGEVVSEQAPIFALADLSTMWLELSIPIEHLSGIGKGVRVNANFQGLDNQTFSGEVIWISSAVNQTNRMIQARALLENPNRLLKDGMFGEAKVIREDRSVLGLPDTAVQRIDEEDVVFVEHEPDLFEIRKILKQHGKPGRIAILSGLSRDETVVLAGSFTVKSEYLKSRLGAGCTH